MCTRCEKLNLGRNECRDDGAIAIAVALAKGAMPKLRVLALNDNRIGDAGLSALGRAASDGAMKELRHLFLMKNTVAEPGCRALATALSAGAWPSLTELVMHHNPATGISKPMCKFWASGQCRNGDACAFHHGSPPPKPDAWRELETACQAHSPPITIARLPEP
jgi:hypothetical protein